MFYRVRRKLMETCYVERDCLVKADSPEAAKEAAILGDDILDEGEDRCQSVVEVHCTGVVEDRVINEDVEWGASLGH